MKDTDYPYAGPSLSPKERPQARCACYASHEVAWASACTAFSPSARTQDIFVFVVGGVTYEESRAVALLNAANKQQRIILGGTCMLNSVTFLKEFEKAAAAAH